MSRLSAFSMVDPRSIIGHQQGMRVFLHFSQMGHGWHGRCQMDRWCPSAADHYPNHAASHIARHISYRVSTVHQVSSTVQCPCL